MIRKTSVYLKIDYDDKETAKRLARENNVSMKWDSERQLWLCQYENEMPNGLKQHVCYISVAMMDFHYDFNTLFLEPEIIVSPYDGENSKQRLAQEVLSAPDDHWLFYIKPERLKVVVFPSEGLPHTKWENVRQINRRHCKIAPLDILGENVVQKINTTSPEL